MRYAIFTLGLYITYQKKWRLPNVSIWFLVSVVFIPSLIVPLLYIVYIVMKLKTSTPFICPFLTGDRLLINSRLWQEVNNFYTNLIFF